MANRCQYTGYCSNAMLIDACHLDEWVKGGRRSQCQVLPGKYLYGCFTAQPEARCDPSNKEVC